MVNTTLEDIKTLLETYFLETDTDPRNITFSTLVDQISESFHWDALDSDTSIDDELSVNRELWKEAFEACQQEAGAELDAGDSFSP